MGVKERRARQKSLLRQEILDAARDILVREGYDSLSMRRGADNIDYSPTAIYLHFKDRDELVFCVCEEFMAGLVREMKDIVGRTSDPMAALRKSLRRYIEFGLANQQQYLATFVIPHANTPEMEARFTEPATMSMQGFGLLVELVAECVRQKKLRRIDVETAARSVWAGVHGLTSLLIVMPRFDWGDRERVIDQLVSMLVDGLR
jgi:AcrR family transcriptional regulator